MSKSRSSSSNLIYGLLAVALAVLLGWLWWESGHPKRLAAKPKPAPTAQAAKPVEAKPPRPIAPAVTTPAAIAPTIRPAISTNAWPRPVQNIFEAQLVLVGQGISSGSLDGVTGS